MTVPEYTPERLCAVPGCGKPLHRQKHYCGMHTMRLRQHGSLDLPVPTTAVAPSEPEEWRPVVGYEGWYEVSDLGRVRRVKEASGTQRGFILRQRPQFGYLMVGFKRDNRSQRMLVHVLVARAFLGPCPAGSEVNHKDFDRANARLANLEYLTHAENMAYTAQAGRMRGVRGEAHHRARLRAEDVAYIRSSDETNAALARRFGVHRGTIGDIRRGRNWRHLLPEDD